MSRVVWLGLCVAALVACSDSQTGPTEQTGGNAQTGDTPNQRADGGAKLHDASASGPRDAKVVREETPASQDGDAQSTTGADAASADSVETSAKVTYFQHVKPFMDAKCVRCHVSGTVAPFALDTVAQAQKFAKASLQAVESGKMPPWKFDPGCSDYQGDFSLTEGEKQLLREWVELDTPAGDPQAAAPALDIGDLGLSRVDVTLQVPEPFTPTEQPDQYRCFPVAWPRTEQAFMTGFRAVPGNPKIVHHIEVYHVPAAEAAKVQALDDEDPGPGYTCFGGPGAGTGTIGGWAPGSPGYDYPAGVGIQIDPGAVIVVQVHYNTVDTQPVADQSQVELKVDAKAIKGGYNFWTNGAWSFRGMPIAAGNADVKHTWTADPTSLAGNKPMILYTSALHMHNLGRTGYMKLKRKDGREECLLKISDWDFHWQGGVRFQKPITVSPGDTIEMQCGFDNSAENQAIGPSGEKNVPRAVNWGENTSDEMCLGILLWGPG